MQTTDSRVALFSLRTFDKSRKLLLQVGMTTWIQLYWFQQIWMWTCFPRVELFWAIKNTLDSVKQSTILLSCSQRSTSLKMLPDCANVLKILLKRHLKITRWQTCSHRKPLRTLTDSWLSQNQQLPKRRHLWLACWYEAVKTRLILPMSSHHLTYLELNRCSGRNLQ